MADIDPIEIAGAAKEVLTMLASASKVIYDFIKKARTVDETIHDYQVEIRQLSNVLRCLNELLEDSRTCNNNKRAPYEQEQWLNIQQTLKNCKETVKRIEEILKKLAARSSGGFWDKAKKQLELDWKAGELAELTKQVEVYRTTIHFCLQCINWYLPIKIGLSHMLINGSSLSKLETVNYQQLSM